MTTTVRGLNARSRFLSRAARCGSGCVALPDSAVEHDSRIEDRETVLVRDHRVEIHLGDIRMRRRDSRDGFQQRDDRVDIDARLTADAAQNLAAAQAARASPTPRVRQSAPAQAPCPSSLRRTRRRARPSPSRRIDRRGTSPQSARPHRAPSAAPRRPRSARRAPWRRDSREFARTRRAPPLHRRDSARRRRRRSCDLRPATALSAPPGSRFATPRAPRRQPSPRTPARPPAGPSECRDSLALDFRENRPPARTSRRNYR